MTIERNENGGYGLTTITNAVGFSLTLSDFGAGVVEMRWDGLPLTIAPKDRETYFHSDGYFGKTVGRIAGRIKDSRLSFANKTYPLSPNEGPNCLHGGPHGLSMKMWRFSIDYRDGSPVPTYSLDEGDGEGGFPGPVSFRVRYHVSEKEARLETHLEAFSPVATPLNLTTHAYFNLGGSPNVLSHEFWVNAHEVETYDAGLIPQGFVACPDCLDFSSPHRVGERIGDPILSEGRTKGYDHCFRLAAHPFAAPVARLSNGALAMELCTDAPCLQVYSDNYPRLGLPLTNGRNEEKNAGLALEPVAVPNDFSAMATIPGRPLFRRIAYRFLKGKAK
jgi:aldose 1-epimerase